MPLCSACGEEKGVSSFYHRQSGTPRRECKGCTSSARARAYARLTPTEKIVRGQVRNRKRKLHDALALGGKCAECGEVELAFLCFDHRKRNGADERRRLGGVRQTHKEMRRSGYSADYRLLCANCNQQDRLDTITRAPAKHPELRRVRAELRARVLQRLGGVCVCCGEGRSSLLAIDHPAGNGQADRARFGGATHGFYRHLLRLPVMHGYRLLCHNCNQATARGDTCPHLWVAMDKGTKTQVEAIKALCYDQKLDINAVFNVVFSEADKAIELAKPTLLALTDTPTEATVFDD